MQIDDQEVIECLSCNKVPDNYLSLNCQHTFCLNCIAQHFLVVYSQLIIIYTHSFREAMFSAKKAAFSIYALFAKKKLHQMKSPFKQQKQFSNKCSLQLKQLKKSLILILAKDIHPKMVTYSALLASKSAFVSNAFSNSEFIHNTMFTIFRFQCQS